MEQHAPAAAIPPQRRRDASALFQQCYFTNKAHSRLDKPLGDLLMRFFNHG